VRIAITNANRQIPQNNTIGSSVLPDFSDEDVNPDIGVKMCAALGILQILQSFFVKSPAHGVSNLPPSRFNMDAPN